ncbi:MAG: hypothetical protein COV10_04180 [Candidatus Vogelbacteria bacterium CG10_big_fil_rev_8_21_14_0_10_51_16]|uniref:Uncharacterized protein n=1 Tax=Candidatus Vogelbacteria bacterium CG10_big_fil_rev_8_21_14_0_10_51_16 TaxID=1975045 RepID=A0A2H0RDE7_9BACT|nr:MAG: hypothetical protein COV10_04180 [Candidatus Vogelbacteria bacterium CG10_big_fil_rev_8_21_14_0_10_51_16]
MLNDCKVLVAGLAEAAACTGPDFLEKVAASGQSPKTRNLSVAIDRDSIRFSSTDHPKATQEALISREPIPDPNMGEEPLLLVLHERNIGEMRKFVCHLDRVVEKFVRLNLPDEVGIEVLLKQGEHPVLLIGTEVCHVPFTLKGRMDYWPITEARAARWEGKRILAREKQVRVVERQRRWLDSSYVELGARPNGASPESPTKIVVPESRPRSHAPDSGFARRYDGKLVITAVRNPPDTLPREERPIATISAMRRMSGRPVGAHR